jgi:transmembrane sensor
VTERNRDVQPSTQVEQDALLSEAAQWAIELSSVEISPQRIDEWRQWIAVGEARREAFDRIQSTFAAVDSCSGDDMPWPTDAETANDAYDGSVAVSAWRARAASRSQRGAGAGRALLERVRRRARWIAVGLAAGVVFAIAAPGVLKVLRSPGAAPHVTIVETRAGENRDVTLADGSVVSVGARSMLWATLDRESREIALERGEAFFRVAKDASRPFVVRAGNTRVAAVGTAFNVRRAGRRIVVAVAEGVVKIDSQGVRQARTESEALGDGRLNVGEQLSINASDGSVDLRRVAPDGVAAWRHGVLQYRDEPLQSVIADVARYSARDIVIADAATADLRVTSTVFTNDVESWIASLETALPLRAVRTEDGVVRLEARARE